MSGLSRVAKASFTADVVSGFIFLPQITGVKICFCSVFIECRKTCAVCGVRRYAIGVTIMNAPTINAKDPWAGVPFSCRLLQTSNKLLLHCLRFHRHGNCSHCWLNLNYSCDDTTDNEENRLVCLQLTCYLFTRC